MSALRFLTLALRGRLAWDVQARHSLSHLASRYAAVYGPRIRMLARPLLCIALALVILPAFLLFGGDRDRDEVYDLD